MPAYEFNDFSLRNYREGSARYHWVNPDRTQTKSQSPYSYSEFFIFGGKWYHEKTKDQKWNAVYSDRLHQWDGEAFARALKVARPFTEHARQAAVQQFMDEYYSQKDYDFGRVVAFAEGCNVSNGYPYWIIWSVPSEDTP